MTSVDGTDEVEEWAAKTRTVEIEGESVAVVDVTLLDLPAGQETAGPPLLVLHGFPTSSIDFQPVLARLSRRRRVVLLDFPGYGLSAKPDRPYSLFDQADVVAAVAAATQLDEVDLLTHDMGDSVGGELLARSLDGSLDLRIRRRVLTNGSIYLDMAQLTDGQKLLRELPDELLPEGLGGADTLTDAVVALCAPERRSGPDGHQVEARLRASVELVVRNDGHRLLARLIRYIDERAEHESRWPGPSRRILLR